MEVLIDYEKKFLSTEGDVLFAEDIKDSQVLFLLQAPAEVDIAKLSGKTVILNGKQDLIDETEEGEPEKFEVQTSTEAENKSSQMVVILPSKEDQGLRATKCISGHMRLIRRIKVPHVQCPGVTATKKKKDDFVKHTWKPFGSRSPKRSRKVETDRESSKKGKRKRRHSHVDSQDSISEELNTTLDITPKKKQKKKRKKSRTQDRFAET